MRVRAPGAGLGALRRSTELAVAAGFVTVVFGCLVITLAMPPPATTGRLILLCAVLVGFAAVVGNLTAAVATAGVALPFYLGFLVDRRGELHWHGQVDLVRAAVLLVAAVAGTALGVALPAVRRVAGATPTGSSQGGRTATGARGTSVRGGAEVD